MKTKLISVYRLSVGSVDFTLSSDIHDFCTLNCENMKASLLTVEYIMTPESMAMLAMTVPNYREFVL